MDMTENITVKQDARAVTGGASRARRILLGFVAAVVMLLAVPTTASAVEWLSLTNANNAATINGGTLAFGTNPQSTLPVTRTIFFGSNTSGTNRRVGVNINLTGASASAYEIVSVANQSVAGSSACSLRTGSPGLPGSTADVILFNSTSTTTFRSCVITLRLKAGVANASHPATLNYSELSTATTGCAGANCTAWSGGTRPGSASITGVAEADNPVVQIWNSTNTAEQATQTFSPTLSGTNSATYTFTIRNAGNVALANPSTQSISGPDASSFSITGTSCGASLAPGATCTVTTRFNPPGATTDITRSATLNIAPTFNLVPSTDSVALSGLATAQTRIPALFDAANASPVSAFDFGELGVGAQANETFTLRNTGNWPMDLTGSRSITGANASEFSIPSTTCGTSLPAGGTCQITVRFEPIAEGTRTAQLAVTPPDATAGSPATIDLTGDAVPPTFIPNIYDTAGTTLKPSHEFPDTVGTLQSAPYVFTLTNDGNATLTGTGPANQVITGADADQFQISATTCGSSLLAGLSCTISVRFQPTTQAPDPGMLKNARLEVNTTNGTPAQAAVDLSGTSIPAISSPEIRDTGNATVLASRDFGSLAVTETTPYVFTIRNNGNVNLNGATLARMVISGPDAAQFSRTTNCTGTLAPNATCTMTVNFSPTSLGAKSATLQLGSINGDPVGDPIPGDPGAFFNTEVDLTGTAVAPVRTLGVFDTAGTTPKPAHSFGGVLFGSNSSYVFTLKNTGNAAVNGLATSITGTDAPRFTRTTTCGATVPRNSSCTVTVTYAPTRSVTQYGVLNVTSSDGGSFQVPMMGAGVGVVIRNTTTTPSNAPTFTDGVPHQPWLDSITLAVGTVLAGDTISASFLADVGAADDIAGVEIGNTNTTSDTPPAVWRDVGTLTGELSSGRVQIQERPGHSQALVVTQVPLNLTGMGTNTFGMSGGFLCIGSTTATNNRRIWFRLRDSAGRVSATVGSRVRFSDAGFNGLCAQGTAWINNQRILSVAGVNRPSGTINTTASKGDQVTVEFNVATRPPALGGIAGGSQGTVDAMNWRLRNTTTNEILNWNGSTYVPCALPCAGNTPNRFPFASNAQGVKQMTITAPSKRGRWVIEGSPQGSNENDNHFYFLGAIQVNDQADPTLSFGGTLGPRPDTDTAYTISANPGDPGDSNGDGEGQVVEWDLDGDRDNGPRGDGFEVFTEGDENSSPPVEALTRVFDTTGKPAGPFTIRARVIDNGSATASDITSRSKIFEYTTTINSLPEATTEEVYVEADDPQGSPVTFRATDANGDPFRVTITPDGGNDGSLGGDLAAGIGQNTKPYSWPTTYTGDDRFSFFATDDKKGSGPVGTLTVRVRPNTTIDDSQVQPGDPGDPLPPLVNPDLGDPAKRFLGSTVATGSSFEFSSPQEPVVDYECRVLRDNPIGDTGNWSEAAVIEDWSACDSITPSPTAATGSEDFSGLEDGLYRFEVRAVNAVGVVDGTPAFRTWRVDNTAPATEVRTGPQSNRPQFQPRLSNQVEPTYALRASDAERSPQSRNTFECRVLFGLMSGQWTPCGDPSGALGSSQFPLVGTDPDFGLTDPFAEGAYEIEFRAIDEVGNVGPALLETLLIDTQAPDTALASGPEGLVNSRDLVYVLSSTQANSTFDCRVEGQDAGVVIPTAPCPGTSPDGSRPTFTVPQDDEYTLIAAATDPATNRDVDPLEVEFEVDATPPTTDLQSVDFGSGPTPLRRTQSRSITVGFTGADANTTRSSGVRLYQCRIDSDNPEAWRTCESPQRFGGLPDGSHKLEIRSLDFAGSPDGAPETVEWVVDRTPPVTTITQAPDPVTNDDQPSFEFTVNEAVDSSTCRLDSLPAVTCDSPVTLAELGAPGALADGPHEFTVSSVDIAGNQEMASASASWEQDTIAPEVELTEHPAAFVPAGPADFVWVVRDGAGMEISSEPLSECQLDAGPWAPCDREFSLTEVENSDGPHVFRVRATDAAGNTSSVVEKSWTVRAGAPPAPSISASQPEDGAVTRLTAASISFGHPDEDTGVLEGLFCQLDNGPFVPCEQNVMYDGLADGDHTFRVIATDIFGNTSPAAVLSWSVQSRAPVTSINSGPNGLTRQRNATVSFSSNRSSTFECRVDGGSWEACSSPLQLTNLVDGPHTVRVRAVSLVDPVGVKDPTPPLREWTVDATAPSATIDSAPSGSGPATSATVLFSSDDPGAAFQCRIGTAPFDACSSPLNLTNLRPGTVNLSVRAVDQAGNLSEPALASWTVDQPTCPPGFQGTPPDCVEIGPIEGPAITGKLREGSLSLAALGSVPLPADQITLSGVRAADGRWLVPKDGVEFLPVVQTIPDAIGPGQNVDVEISISATNDGLGTLPSGGGPATFVLPVKADVVAKLNGLTLPLGDECSLKPITFDLTGTYDEAGKSVTLSSPNVGFPTVTGCGTFKAIVDSLLELPRDDIAISLTFDLEQAAPSAPRLTKPRIKAPKSVKAGKPVTIRGRFTNTGGTDARGVKVCLKSPRAVVKGPGSRCRMVDVPAGASRTVSFKVTTKKGTKGKRARFTYSARYTASGAKVITRTGHVTLMK